MYILSLGGCPFCMDIVEKYFRECSICWDLKEAESKVTEEEIKSIVQEGKEDGEVQEVEQDIVERVFLLGDLKVDDIMTQRNEIIWLHMNMTKNEVMEMLWKISFSICIL